MPSAVTGGTAPQSSGDSQIRSTLVECQRRGWNVKVILKSGETLIGKRVKTSQDSFRITVGTEEKTIAYSDVQGAGSYFVKSNTAWNRLGRGLETAVGFAALGTFVVVSYPTTKLAEHRADARAREIEQQIKAALNKGSSKSEVIAFLNSKKIGRGKLTFQDSASSGVNPMKPNLIHAVVNLRNEFSFDAYYIQLVFYFDGSDRLVDYKVDVVADTL
jgi:hypothetical protein